MDGERVTPRTDAESERSPGAAKQAVGVSHAGLGDGIFIHPNRNSIPFCSRITILIMKINSKWFMLL